MSCSKLPAMESLERESVRSLYEQAADRLRAHFMGMRPGERVPTEAELTRIFQVGRSTIRKALQRFVEEGLLVRSPGKGTFIARAVPCIIHSIDRVSAFMDTFRRNGEDVRTQMIDFGWLGREVPLPEKLRDWPRPVLRFDRLYVSRGIPHAVARVCLPYTIGNHISSGGRGVHAGVQDAAGKIRTGTDGLGISGQLRAAAQKYQRPAGSFPQYVPAGTGTHHQGRVGQSPGIHHPFPAPGHLSPQCASGRGGGWCLKN